VAQRTAAAGSEGGCLAANQAGEKMDRRRASSVAASGGRQATGEEKKMGVIERV
jgi:hypothetical protein